MDRSNIPRSTMLVSSIYQYIKARFGARHTGWNAKTRDRTTPQSAFPKRCSNISPRLSTVFPPARSVTNIERRTSVCPAEARDRLEYFEGYGLNFSVGQRLRNTNTGFLLSFANPLFPYSRIYRGTLLIPNLQNRDGSGKRKPNI